MLQALSSSNPGLNEGNAASSAYSPSETQPVSYTHLDVYKRQHLPIDSAVTQGFLFDSVHFC